MTPDAYQRGHRDSLLDAAAQIDSMASVYDRAAERTRAGRGFSASNPTHYGCYIRELGQAQALRWACDLLRDLADRCPDDPMCPTEKETP